MPTSCPFCGALFIHSRTCPVTLAAEETRGTKKKQEPPAIDLGSVVNCGGCRAVVDTRYYNACPRCNFKLTEKSNFEYCGLSKHDTAKPVFGPNPDPVCTDATHALLKDLQMMKCPQCHSLVP